MITWEYLAGFTDGEGCIKVYMNGGRLRPRITYGQKYHEVLDVIQDFLHEEIKFPKRAITLSRSCYYLQINQGGWVGIILDKLLPHLVVKRADALVALEHLGPPRGFNGFNTSLLAPGKEREQYEHQNRIRFGVASMEAQI